MMRSDCVGDDSTPDAQRIRCAILELVQERGVDKTCCPSEVARSLGGDAWRELMDAVRHEASGMALSGQIVISQGGQPVDPEAFSGPVRLGLA